VGSIDRHWPSGLEGGAVPPKEIREKLGIRPHMKVMYRVERGALIVEPIPSLEDVLREPCEVEISLEEFREFRRELSRGAES